MSSNENYNQCRPNARALEIGLNSDCNFVLTKSGLILWFSQ